MNPPDVETLRYAAKIARSCTDYGGGYRSDDGKLEAFHHGMETVANVLDGAIRRAETGAVDTQLEVIERQAGVEVSRETFLHIMMDAQNLLAIHALAEQIVNPRTQYYPDREAELIAMVQNLRGIAQKIQAHIPESALRLQSKIL